MLASNAFFAYGKACEAIGHIPPARVPAGELALDVAVPHDGPGNALMKEAHIQKQGAEFLLGHHLSAVNVHHIGQELKGIKRNADGQRDFRDEFRNTEQRLRVAEQESGVFEHGEEPEVDGAGEHEAELCFSGSPVFADKVRKEPVGKRHADQQQDIHRLAPGIKHQRKNEHHRVFGSDILCERIKRQIQRQKHIQKQ